MAVINGTNGMDTLTGTNEDDEVHGLRGNDVLVGSAGADTLDGGAGFDTADYSWSGAGITIDLSRGVSKPGIGGDAEGDLLKSIEKVIGSQFDDTFITSVAGRTLEGGWGNDTYIINAVGSKIIEQSGWSFGNDDLVLTSLAHFKLDENIERLTYTGTGKFTGYGNADDNVITGGAGNDVLLGGGGADHLIGGAGWDTASYTDSAQGLTFDLMRGANTTGIANGDTFTDIEAIRGSNHDDVFIGGKTFKAVDGAGGFDTVDYSMSDGAITLDIRNGTGKPGVGGDADGVTLKNIEHIIGTMWGDTYVINALGVTISERSFTVGVDEIRTGLASYTLDANIESLTYTGTASFTGYGNADNNTLTGGAGNDVLLGGGGADHLIGGEGIDTASYADSTEGLTIGLASGVASSGIAYGDTYTSIELIRGSNYDDHFWADEAPNDLDGGDGFDTVDYSSSNGAVTVDLRAGVSLPGSGGSAEGDTLSHIEKVIGTYANDTFTSSVGGVTFQGGWGDDVYNVNAEGVTIVEDQFMGGYDELRTGLAVKTLDSFVEKLTYTGTADFTGYGNDSENIIQGGQGNDLLFGGDGADTFVGGDGVDVVSYGDSKVGVSLNLDTREFSGIAEHDQYLDIEILRGSHFNDTLTGNFIASNYFEGGLGNDVIRGGIFADHLYGGLGPSNGPSAEVDTGSAPQADLLYGGNGDDVIVTAVDDRGSFAYGEGGNDTITVASGTADGGWDNDVLTGTGNNYVLLGGQGDDQLIMNGSGFANGGEGDDTYIVNTSNLVTIRDDGPSNWNDTLILNNVATAADLNLMRVGNDLYLYSRVDQQAVVPDHGVKLQDWYAGGDSIENFKAANGDILPVSADAFSLFG